MYRVSSLSYHSVCITRDAIGQDAVSQLGEPLGDIAVCRTATNELVELRSLGHDHIALIEAIRRENSVNIAIEVAGKLTRYALPLFGVALTPCCLVISRSCLIFDEASWCFGFPY